MEIRGKQPLGIELVKRGIVDGDAIERALQYQIDHPDRKLGDILYILNEANPKILIKEIGDIIGIKGIFLTDDTIKIDMEEYIPLDLMKKYRAIPFDTESGRLKVAFSEVTNNKDSIKNVRMLALNKGLVLENYIAFDSNVEEFFRKYDNKSKSI